MTARRLLALLIAALALLALAPAVATAAPRTTIGVADQKASAFADTRFRSLRVRHVRRTVAWDALSSRWQRAELDAWMRSAHAAGARPLIAFGRSRVHAKRKQLPSPARLAGILRQLRKRYPYLREVSTWNEANLCGEPTCHRAAHTARLYRALKRACRSCTVLAADLLDVDGMVPWAKAFVRALGYQPRYWGLHNYVSANRFRPGTTRALLRAVRGEVWLTETGGLVARRNRSRVPLRTGQAHAARVTRFIFDRLVPLSRRITRVYLYHWSAGSRRASWDSGLVGADGRPRPALAVLRRALAARR